MMDADVEVRCNAGYGEVTPDRVNSRNGYRRREWDTRAGTVELANGHAASGQPVGDLGGDSAVIRCCCGGGRSPECPRAEGCEPGEAGDDAGALEEPAEVDEPG